MKLKIFIFIFLFTFKFFFSQEEAPPSVVVEDYFDNHYRDTYSADSLLEANPETSNTVFPKTFDADFKNKYKKDPDFDYSASKPKESFWQKLKKRIDRFLESIFGKLSKTNSYAETVLRILGVLLIGVVLYFLIKFLMSKDGNFFFSKKNRKLHIAENDIRENIHEINFPQTILALEKQKDFRAAIRYQFLFILKKLSDKKLIDWNIEKTNKDYLHEIQDKNLKKKFRELVHIFDYVWYGEFDINETDYEKFKQKFEE
jgi:uncharacterized membrane protein required for colicin V production